MATTERTPNPGVIPHRFWCGAIGDKAQCLGIFSELCGQYLPNSSLASMQANPRRTYCDTKLCSDLRDWHVVDKPRDESLARFQGDECERLVEKCSKFLALQENTWLAVDTW